MAHSFEGPFQRAFRGALADSGMTLVEIVDALEERNIKLTQASLSYWQSGRSVPRRQSSIAVLSDVEEVLGVDKGTLSNALEQEKEEHAKNAEFAARAKKAQLRPELLWSAPRGFDVDIIDWENEVQRKFLHQTMTIRNGGHNAVTRVDAVARVTGTQSPTLHVCESWALGDTVPEISDVYGGVLDNSHIDDAGRYAVFSIALPVGKESGDLHQLGYTVSTETTDRITHTPQAWFTQSIDMYAFTVDFGDEIPTSVEWVNVTTRQRGDTVERIETTHELDIIGGIAQATVERFSDTATFIRWSW